MSAALNQISLLPRSATLTIADATGWRISFTLAGRNPGTDSCKYLHRSGALMEAATSPAWRSIPSVVGVQHRGQRPSSVHGHRDRCGHRQIETAARATD